MEIGGRLRTLREERKFSQGDIEQQTGLLRCYVSRVENGFTIPNVQTLEKFARALKVPMYQLFYDSDKPTKIPKLLATNDEEELWGASGKAAQSLARFRRLLGKMNSSERNLLLSVAQGMAKRR